MKSNILYLLLFCCSMAQLNAQERSRFSPKEFTAKLKEYIAKEAKMTSQEANLYFAKYDKLNEKRRKINNKMIFDSKTKDEKTLTDNEYAEIIQRNDELRLQIVKLEIEYNKKYLKIIPAKKVFEAQKAEQRFHRRMLRHAAEEMKSRQQRGEGSTQDQRPRRQNEENPFR